MSEIASRIPAPKIQSRRCLGCRLPQEVQEEIARDRFRGWATFAHLVQKLSAKGFKLSEASVRRHLRHVEPNSQFAAAEPEDRSQENVSTPFDGLVNAQVLEDRLVVEVMARALVERLQPLERAQRATRNPAQAERR